VNVKKLANPSRIIGQDMPVAIYGHFGSPLIVFPTANQDFEEYERQGMIDSLGEFLQAGMIKLYCVTSINEESWMNRGISPAERAARQAAYDRHVTEELVPLIQHDCQSNSVPLGTIGSSFGAYHAANTLLKHPEIFRTCIAMSGIYNVSQYFDGYYDDNCFQNNPPDYIPHLDGERLQALHQCKINILCGQGAWERVEWSRELPAALTKRGIPNNFDLWGPEVSHDWPWWKLELQQYLPRLFG
jgi:esterase/lipase superfamily enzyme